MRKLFAIVLGVLAGGAPIAALIAPVQKAEAAITLRCSTSNPADGVGLDGTAAVAVTPCGTAVTGDLVVIHMYDRGSGHSNSVSNTGGQSWTEDCENTTGSPSMTVYHAIFNGTWSANPSFADDFLNSSAVTVTMDIYIPSGGGTFSNTPDVACSTAYTGSGTTHTITGQTPTASASVVTSVSWGVPDKSVTMSALTAGWTTRGSDDDLSNAVAGTGIMVSVADMIQTSAAATGNVSETSSLSTTAATTIITFKETITAHQKVNPLRGPVHGGLRGPL